MTVFDVLRWPISVPPTEEELSRLPYELFKEWVDTDVGASNLLAPYHVAHIMQKNHKRGGVKRIYVWAHIKCLRERIKVWDT